jgi:hypothetical protein
MQAMIPFRSHIRTPRKAHIATSNPNPLFVPPQNGYPDVDPLGDLNTELERALGRVVKERYGTDFFILHR